MTAVPVKVAVDEAFDLAEGRVGTRSETGCISGSPSGGPARYGVLARRPHRCGGRRARAECLLPRFRRHGSRHGRDHDRHSAPDLPEPGHLIGTGTGTGTGGPGVPRQRVVPR